MDAATQQQILYYFIEEAKEHLETLEKGILELSSAVEDSERINEMFRAAHSIKGGAAMLGYGSIQKTSHRLEDAFKILREHKIEVDQRLESLLLQGYDVLQDLIERLQSPSGLPNDEAEAIIKETEPTFVQLQDYLKQLLGDGAKTPDSEQARLPEIPLVRQAPEPMAISSGELAERVKAILKQMLELFKQKPTPESRQQIQQLCLTLAKLAPEEQGWQALLTTAKQAIANPKYSYRTLAPIVIQELKRGSDRLQLGKGGQIAPSPDLQKLAAAKFPQVLVSVEPKSAADKLLKTFDKHQLSQLVELLQAAI